MTKYDYDFISDTISENRRAVVKNGLWGFVDEKFNLIIEPKYIEVFNFQNGYCEARSINGWGFIDSIGMEICDFEYNLVFPFSPDGYAVVAKNFEYNIIDSNGSLIFNKFVRHIKHFKDFCYLLNTSEGQKIFLINSRTQLSGAWDSIKILSDTIIVGTKGKFGLLDFNGNYTLQQDYDEIKSISPIHFSLKKEGKYGVYNIKTNMFSDFKFDSIRPPLNLGQPALLAKMNLQFGLIDSNTLKPLTPVIYDDISEISIKDNTIKATVIFNSKPGFIYIR